MRDSKPTGVKRLKISRLVSDPQNANLGTERGAAMLEHSLRSYGAGRSILLDAKNRIISGNKTVEQAGQIGMDDVIVVETDGTKLVAVRRTDMDLERDESAKMLALADNRVGEVNLSWSADVLGQIAGQFDVSMLFSDGELADIVGQNGSVSIDEGPEPQIDKADELRQKWNTQPGQLWEIASETVGGKMHRIACGDCTIAERTSQVSSGLDISAVVTDPVYGISQEGVENDESDKFEDIIDGAVEALPITSGVIVAFQSTRRFGRWLKATLRKGFTFERMLWMYKAAQCTYPWRGWIMTSESILVSSTGTPQWQDVKPYSHDCYYLSEVSGQLTESQGWHGSVKPLSVVSDIVKRVCPPRGVVFDGFLGSGTTAVACEKQARQFIGMDIDPGCVAVCLQRLYDMGLRPRLVKCI